MQEYHFGPRKVFRYRDRGFITIPKPLVDQLCGKHVLVKFIVLEEVKEKKEAETNDSVLV